MAIIFEYLRVPILQEEDPGAQLARHIIKLLDGEPARGGLPSVREQTRNHYITSCNVAPYLSLNAHDPNGIEIQCTIKLVNSVPH